MTESDVADYNMILLTLIQPVLLALSLSYHLISGMGKNPTKSFPHSQVARFTCIVYLVPREDEDHIVHITDKIQRNENKTDWRLSFVHLKK